MGFFQRRHATRDLTVAVSHPALGETFTRAEAAALIADGADVNAVMPEGYSPLAHVCVWGNLEVAEVLLEHGADPNGNRLARHVPLHVAASNGHVDLVRLLADRGADVNSRDADGRTALHHAVVPNKARRSAVLELLVECGADPSVSDNNGETALAAFQAVVARIVGQPPVGLETCEGREQEDRELRSDVLRLQSLFASVR